MALCKSMASRIPKGLALRVLSQFDVSASVIIAKQAQSHIQMKIGQVQSYRYCDDVWTVVLRQVAVMEGNVLVDYVDKIKLITTNDRVFSHMDSFPEPSCEQTSCT
ncbi:transcription initiation factor IIA subunit 2-like isoform X2 [Oratosquilla oratoria]|uniref:transcription initiation factor IIA subunit 2-like isoform X2 n=1 Tax=Oratosquilla oratoria TaxID=337810 RepID=UPI003F75EEE5